MTSSALVLAALLVLATGAAHASDSKEPVHFPADYSADTSPDDYIPSVLDSVNDRYRLEYRNGLGDLPEGEREELENLRRRHEEHQRFVNDMEDVPEELADDVSEDHIQLYGFLSDVADRHKSNNERLSGIDFGEGSFTRALVEYLRENDVSLNALEYLYEDGQEISTLKGFWDYGHRGYNRVLYQSSEERQAHLQERASEISDDLQSLNELLSEPQVGQSCTDSSECSGVEVCCLTTYAAAKCTIAPQCVMPTDIPGYSEETLGKEHLEILASDYDPGKRSYSAKEHAKDKGYTCKAFDVEDQGPCPFCAAFALSVAVSERLCMSTNGVANTLVSPQWVVENFQNWHHQRKDFRDMDEESSTVAPGFLGTQHEMAGLDPYLMMSDDEDSLEENNGGALPLWCLNYHCSAPSLKARKSAAKAASRFVGKIKKKSYPLLGDNPLVDSLRRKEMVRRSPPMASWFGVRVQDRDEVEATCGDKVVRTLVDSEDPADFIYFEDGVRPGLFLKSMMKYGPYAIGISMDLRNPTSWEKVGNVYVPKRFFNVMDHDVVLVGYGTDETPHGPLDYYLIQNSYGVDWGENGYFKVQRGVPESCRGQFKGLGSSKQNTEYTGPCGLDMFVAHSTVLPSPALRGPRISPHTKEQWMNLFNECKTPCQNNGEMLRDCSCHCFHPWGGQHCEVCTRNCGFGTLIDSKSCSCKCDEGAWDADCSKRLVLRVCSRESKDKTDKKEVMIGVEESTGVMADEDGWIELNLKIDDGDSIMERDIYVNVESRRLEETEYLFEEREEFNFSAMYSEREDIDEFGRTRGLVKRQPQILGGVKTPCDE